MMKDVLETSKRKYKQLSDLIQQHKVLEKYLLKLDQTDAFANKPKNTKRKKIFKQRKG
jgi:hypothetical protein